MATCTPKIHGICFNLLQRVFLFEEMNMCKTSLSWSEVPCVQSGHNTIDGEQIPSLSGAAQFLDLYYTPLFL